MAVNIGPKIGLDGEAEFRKNLQQIGQQLKTLGTEMKAVTSAFDANDKSQEALSSQAQVLNRQLTLQEQRLSEIQRALDYARQNYDENSNEVQRWQQAMNNATAEVNTTRAQLSRLESEMTGADRAADGLAAGMKDAGDAADDSSGKFDAATVAIGNLAANAISAAVSAIGDLISSLWNLDEATEEYRAAQGRLTTAFEAAGYSADDAQAAYQAFYGILGDTGQATEASQLLAQLSLSQRDLSTWTEIAAGVYGTFGESLPIEGLIEAANETANVGTVTGVLADALNWVGISEDEFNAKLAECTTEAEKNQLIMDTLAGQYDEAADSFYRNNDAIVAARMAQEGLNQVTAELGDTIGRLKAQLSSDMLPAIAGLGDAFNSLLLGQAGAPEAFALALQNLIQTVVTMLPQFITAGTQILGSVISGILQSIPTLIAAIPQIVGSFIQGLMTAFPQILNSGMEMIRQLATGIVTGIPEFVAQLPQIITEFLNFIMENLPSIVQKGAEILSSLTSGIISGIPSMIAQIPAIITSFTGFIADNLPTILQSGLELLASLVKGILQGIPDLVAQLPQIINAIVNGIANLMGDVIQIGVSIVQGIWQGIQSMISWFTSQVTSFFSGIINGVKSVLGIASPSKIFADIGENMALGLGKGWTDQMGQISRDIERSIPTPTIETVNNAAAGMVNGLSAMSMPSFPQTIVLTLENGAEIARWLLPYNRMAARANPEVVSGV